MHGDGGTPGRARRGLSPGRELAVVSALYLLLTIVLTYPTVLRLSSHIPGSGDAPRMVWDLWAFAQALTDPQVPLSTTDLILYPLPEVHTLWEATPSLLLGVPLDLLLGPVVGYNLLFLLSFVLAGSLAFLLVRSLSANRVASFVAGAIFTFSAYHYAHGLGHMHLLSIQWLPLCLLLMLQLWDRPDLMRAIRFGLAMALAVATSPYYAGYFLAPVLVCFIVYQAWRSRERLVRRRYLGGLALALGLTAAGALLAYPRLFAPEEGTTTALRRDAGDTERYSADLVAYLVPSATHPLWGPVVSPIYSRLTASENLTEMTVYLGWGSMLLALWGLAVRKGSALGYWVLVAVVGFLLSLGPVLHVLGRSVIALPYSLLIRLPLFWTLRAPSRASVVVLLAVAVLAGYGLNDILGRVRRQPRAGLAVGAVILLLVCFESLYSFPYQSSAVSLPPFYRQVLASSSCETLFELPGGPGHDSSTAWNMLYQTYHGRRLAQGYLARQREAEILFPYWVLGGRFLSPPLGGSSTDTWPAFRASLGDLLALNGVDCVVAQRQAGPLAKSYSDEEYREAKASLTRALGDASYEDGGLTAYEVSPVTPEAVASFSGKLELVGHKIVEATVCPDGAACCTFLVTFWRAATELPERYGINVQLVRHNGTRVLAETSHNLGYQFTLGQEVACYRTAWWQPGVVVSDYTVLPSTDSEDQAVLGPIEIMIIVTEPSSGVILPARSDHYEVEEQGGVLLESHLFDGIGLEARAGTDER